MVLLIVCVAFPAIQVIYLLVFLVVFRRARTSQPGDSQVPLSVIVCAHDEEENLKVLLPLLLAQDHTDFEVVIVDDRSNDGSHDYLLEATKRYAKLKTVQIAQTPSHISGKKYALTLGIRAAKNEWIVLTDADCRPDSRSWLRSMSSLFTDSKQIVIACSPYFAESGLLNSLIRYETMLTIIQYIGLALAGRPYMGVGRNLAYRKSLFLENKGFNDHLKVQGGDDDLFVNRHATAANTGVAIGSDTLVHSVPKRTWRTWWTQKIRHLSVGRRYRSGDKFVLGLYSMSSALSWFSLLAIPFVTTPYEFVIMGAFVLRWIFLLAVLATARRKVGEPIELWKVPFLDFIYTFYYLVASPVALLSKKVRWKS
jgi:glycosyltransferase involved in cell wall biosynthesis